MPLKLKPSARIKRRYLLLNADSKETVEKIILDYIGILGWAKAAPFFVQENKNKIILAIDRSAVTEIKAAFEISDKNIRVLRISGTLKGLNK